MQRQAWAEARHLAAGFRILATDADRRDRLIARRHARWASRAWRSRSLLSGSRGVIRAGDSDTKVLAAAQVIRGILAELGRPGEPILIEGICSGLGTEHRRSAYRGRARRHGDLRQARHPGRTDLRGDDARHAVPPGRAAACSGPAASRSRPRGRWGCGFGRSMPRLRIDTTGGGERLAMLELAARSIGGLCSRALRFAEGVSLETLILENALGGRHSPPRHCRAQRVFSCFPWNAPASSGSGSTARPLARAVPGITGLLDHDCAGSGCTPAPLGDRYLGFLFACRSPRLARCEAALRGAYRKLQSVIT